MKEPFADIGKTLLWMSRYCRDAGTHEQTRLLGEFLLWLSGVGKVTRLVENGAYSVEDGAGRLRFVKGGAVMSLRDLLASWDKEDTFWNTTEPKLTTAPQREDVAG